MSDPYTVALSASGSKTLLRLPVNAFYAAQELMAGPLTNNPYRLSKPLGPPLEHLRTVRVGPFYRLLIKIEDDTRTVVVVRALHRADAYRSW